LSLVSANDRQQFVVVEEITARRVSAARTPHQLKLFHRRAAYAIPRSVRLSHSAADLGAQLPSAIGTLAACSLAMCGLRNCPRTDVDPPRVELPSAGGISSRRPRGDNLFNTRRYASAVYAMALRSTRVSLQPGVG